MSEGVEGNTRAIEETVVTDFEARMSYGGYLDLGTLLSAQRPLSDPEHHDELLFIIQHQTTELWLKLVRESLEAPSLYDEFLRMLARSGYPIPTEVLERDVTKAWTFTPELVPIFASIYADPQSHWAAYETCEELVDLEDNFQLWRFRHLKTVDRIIGFKKGTGGSSGVPFLQKALELTFFPELFAVRTEIGQ